MQPLPFVLSRKEDFIFFILRFRLPKRLHHEDLYLAMNAYLNFFSSLAYFIFVQTARGGICMHDSI